MGDRPEIDDTIARLEQMVVADPVEAMTITRETIANLDPSVSVAHQLTLHRLLAMALAHTNQFQESLETIGAASSLPSAGTEPVGLARLQLASMQPLAHLRRVEESIAAGREATAVFQQLNEDAFAGRAALNTGAILAMTGRHREALESFDQALNALTDDPILAGQIETNRGTSLAAVDRFVDAETAFAHAGELTAEHLPWAAAIVEGNLASLASRQGDINRSLRHFEAARRYLEEDDALADLGRLEAEEGAVLGMAGMIGPARERFTRALELLQEHGSPSDLAIAKIGYGRILVDRNQPEEALSLLATLENEVNAEDYPETWQQYLVLAIRLALESGEFDVASTYIEAGKSFLEDLPIQRLSWDLLEAEVHRRRGDDAPAEAILRDALARAADYGVTPITAAINESLSRVVRDRGDEQEANAFAREAIHGYESIRGTIVADQLRQAWHHSRLGAYGDLARSLVSQPEEASQREAFDIFERIRSRALLDSLGGDTGANDDLPAGSDAEQRLANDLSHHRRWLNWTYSTVARGQELSDSQLQELKEREREASRLEDRLAVLRPTVSHHDPVNIENVQERMPTGTAVLTYFAFDDSVALQLITKNQIVGIADICHTTDLTEMVGNLQFQMGRALVSGTGDVSARRAARLRRDTDVQLERMYDVLVAPIADDLEGIDRLVVVPTSDLHSVPFAALRHGDAYLGERYTITTAPSVSVHSNLIDSAAKSTNERALIIGVSDEAAPGLGIEAQSLSQEIPGAQLLLGEAATRERIRTSSSDVGLIHLACHGRFDPMLPAASGLQVGDGWLTLADVQQMRLNQSLVVMSGCETGRARVDRGDDLIGLVASFIAAGAGSLVTSLWKTHDEATLALVESLYTALHAGSDLATALQVSQAAVRAQFDHPAMWAPFVGLGSTRKEA